LIALNNLRVFLCTEDTDMRKSFSALPGIIRRSMHLDPLSGYLFVFKNKRADRIKVFYWDRDGVAIWYKLLQKGTFKFPNIEKMDSAGIEIDTSTLRLIIDGVDLASIRLRQRYRLEEREPHTGVSQPLDKPFPALMASTANTTSAGETVEVRRRVDLVDSIEVWLDGRFVETAQLSERPTTLPKLGVAVEEENYPTIESAGALAHGDRCSANRSTKR